VIVIKLLTCNNAVARNEERKKMKIGKIELKAINHCEFASDETNCYEGKVYVDGKPMIDVSNEGHGGCDNQYPIKPFTDDDVKKVDKWCCKNLPKWSSKQFDIKDGFDKGKSYDTDLEMWCGDQVSKFLLSRELKRLMNGKIVYVKNKEIYEYGFKKTRKLEQKHFIHFNNYSQTKGYEKITDFKVLNTIPFDKALEIYTKRIS